MAKTREKINWERARNEYLEDSTLSYMDIAKKYGVAKKTVENRAKSEGWVALRQKLGENAFEKFQEHLVDEKSKAQSRHLLQYQNLQAIINQSIMAFSKGNFWTDKKGNLIMGADNKPIPVPPDARQLESLAKAAKISMDGERTVLGLPTTVAGLTDGKGDSVWTGFSDMVKSAAKVLDGAGTGKTNSTNSGGNTA